MPQMKFKVHTDPGHGWLFVTHEQLETLGLNVASFTQYSYRNADGVYAEEDFDAGTVISAHYDKFKAQPQLELINHPGDAPCRRYARCIGDVDTITARQLEAIRSVAS